MSKKCKGCIHRRTMSGSQTYCHYILDTLEARGCSVDECNKYNSSEEDSKKYIAKNRSLKIYPKGDW